MKSRKSVKFLIVSSAIFACAVTSAGASVTVPEVDLEELVREAAPVDQPQPLGDSFIEDDIVVARSVDSELQISLDEAGVVTMTDQNGAASIRALPDVTLSHGELLDGGAVAFDAEDGTALLVEPMADASVRLAVIIDDPSQPSEYEYSVVPDGGYVESSVGGLLIFDANGQFLGGVLPPWARDREGRSVPTHFEVRDDKVVQVVEHDASYSYPIVADPLFARGIIKRVNREVWNSSKGGYELQAEVTGLARFVWMAGRTDIVIVEGYRDLIEHYPRSMAKATMFQQWECHAVGLIGTFKIDLEGWRSSKPNWRKTEIWNGVKDAIRHGDPKRLARACNW